MSLKLDTPDNVLEMSESDILDLCIESEGPHLPLSRRMTVVKHLFRAMNLDLTADVALSVVSNPKYKMLIAGAGAGKSTVIHANILIDKVEHALVTGKILPGNRILFLAFAENNVIDMLSTHSQLVRNIRKSKIKGAEIDERLDARTFHAFCKSWFDEYQEYLGYKDATLETSDADFLSMLERNLAFVRRKFEVREDVNIVDMLKLYRMALETMTPFDSPKIYDLEPNLPCSLEALKAWFTIYTTSKKSMKKYDFTDIIVGFNRLTRENEKFLERMKENFDALNLDECQDFNPIMIDSVKNMSKYLKVTMIGDEDQLIFAFRGADYMTMAMFKEYFEGGKVYSMFFNRRCRAKICEFGQYVVKKNTRRFDKKILPMKPGGEIILKGYSTEEGQLFNLIRHLKEKPPEELSKVAIATKENAHTMILTQRLEDEGILHHMKKGYGPYSHEIYNHYINILNLIDSPYDPYAKRELFKVLPITRSQLAEVIEDSNGDLNFEVASKHFCEIDYGSFERISGFRENLKNLETISKMARNEPIKNYIRPLTNLFYSYYWNHRLKSLDEKDPKRFPIYQYFTSKAFEYFDKPQPLKTVVMNLQQRRDTLERISDSGHGVGVGTMHSFKGLEADEFHLLYMDAEIFPSSDVRDTMSEEGITKAIEAETFLAYVGITRAKDTLFMHYNINRPSIYVSMAQQFLMNYKEAEIYVPKMDLQSKVSSGSPAPSQPVVSKPIISVPKESHKEELPPAQVHIASFQIPDVVVAPRKEVPSKPIELREMELDIGFEEIIAAPQVAKEGLVIEEDVKPESAKPLQKVQQSESRVSSFLNTFKL